MAGLLFGTAGVPRSAGSKTTVAGIERLAQLGLTCMEVEFVQRVSMGEAGAQEVAEAAARAGVRLTVHAPYYINLNAREPEKVAASQKRLLQAARVGALCGAESVAFHAAFYMGDTPEQAYTAIKRHLAEVLEALDEEGNRIWIRPEVTGRRTQFGDLAELLDLSTELERVAPCVDFAHCHARTGGFNSYAEFMSLLALIEERLGRAALDSMHLHVAGIEYGPRGEQRHLDLAESDLNYLDLLRALRDREVKGFVICESPNLEADALLLQAAYRDMVTS